MAESVTDESRIPERDTGSRSIFAQLIRFGIVGAFCAVLDFGSYKALLAFTDVSPYVDAARGISFIIGTATAYVLNKRFTFGASGGIWQASGFTTLYGTTFAVAVGVNSLLLHALPTPGWRVEFAWLISQAMATTINFIMLRLVVFRERTRPTSR